MKIVGVCGAAMVLLNGCGSGGDSSTSTAMPDPVVPTQTIAELAVATKDLSTLVAALSACDLVNTFNGTEKFTVFAPVDTAFAALDAATLSCLLAPVGLPTLTEVLKYHVVSGAALAKDLSNGQELDTLDGKQQLKVVKDGTTVKVGDGTVIAADIMATNGVVHEVDAVLIPEDFVAPMCGDAGSIADLAVATASLSTLVAALSAADLVDTFNGTTVFTVFAPTDDAFAALGDGAVACLTEKANIPALTEVLKYHVVAGYDLAASITDGLMVDTLDDQKLTFTLVDGMVKIDGASTVSAADNYATNGVVHVIDAVLIPDGWTNPCAGSTLAADVLV